MSVDAVNLAAANKRHGIVNTGEIVEGLAGLGDPLVPLEGQIIDLSKYPELYRQRDNFIDSILYPESVIDVEIENISGISAGLYNHALPATIGIFQAREPDMLVLMPMYRADYNDTQPSSFTFYKVKKYTHEIVQTYNVGAGFGNRGVVSLGYAFHGNTEYYGVRLGGSTPDSFIFYSDDNFNTFKQGNYPTMWGNAAMAIVDGVVINFFPANLVTNPPTITAKFSSLDLLSGPSESAVLPPTFSGYIVANYTTVWKGLVIGVVVHTNKTSAVVAASPTKEIINITNNMCPKANISEVAGSDKVLAVVTTNGEIWYTEKFDNIHTKWIQALQPITSKVLTIIAVSDYEFFIGGDSHSFFFNVKTKKIRFVEASMQRGYVDNRDPNNPVIRGFYPFRYGWGMVTVSVRAGAQGSSFLTKIKQINNFDNLNPNGGGFIWGCRGKDGAWVQLFTPAIKSLKDTVNTAKILISSDQGKSYDVRLFKETFSGQELTHVYSLVFTNNKYYAVCLFGTNMFAMYSSPDLITWTLETSAGNATGYYATTDNNKVYYAVNNGSAATSDVYVFDGTTHTRIFTEGFATFDSINGIAANGQFIAISSKKKIVFSLNGGSTWAAAASWGTTVNAAIVYDPQYDRMVIASSYQGMTVTALERNGTWTNNTHTFTTGMPTQSVQRIFLFGDKIIFNGINGGFCCINRDIKPTSKITQIYTPFDNISNLWFCYTSFIDPQSDHFLLTAYRMGVSSTAVYECKLRTLEDDLYFNKAICGWKKTGQIEELSANLVMLDRFAIGKDGTLATTATQWCNPAVDRTNPWAGSLNICQPSSYTINGSSVYAPKDGLSTTTTAAVKYHVVNTPYFNLVGVPDQSVSPAVSKLCKYPTLGDNLILTTVVTSTTTFQNYPDICAGITILQSMLTNKSFYHDNGSGANSWPAAFVQANFGFAASNGGITSVVFGKNTVVAMSSQNEISYALNDIIGATWKNIPSAPGLFELPMATGYVANQMSYVNGVFATYSNNTDRLENKFGWYVPSTAKTTIIISYDGANFTKVSEIPGRALTPPCALGDYYAIMGVQTANNATPSHPFSKDFIMWFPTIYKENGQWKAITNQPALRDKSCARNNVTAKYTIVCATGEIYENDLDPNTIGRRWSEVDFDLMPEALGSILYSRNTKRYYAIGLRSGKLYSTDDIENPTWLTHSGGTFPVVKGFPGIMVVYTMTANRYIIPKVFSLTTQPLAIFDIQTNQFLPINIPSTWTDVHEIHFIKSLNKWVFSITETATVKLFTSTDLLTFTPLANPTTGLTLYDAASNDNTYFVSGYYTSDLITWKQLRLNGTGFLPKNLTEYNIMGKNILTIDRTGQIWKFDSSGNLINTSINRDLRFCSPQPGRIFPHGLTGYSEFDNIGLVWCNATILFTTNGINFFETGVPMELTSYIISLTTDGERIITVLCDGTVYISKQFNNTAIPDRVTMPCIPHPNRDTQYYLYSGK